MKIPFLVSVVSLLFRKKEELTSCEFKSPRASRHPSKSLKCKKRKRCEQSEINAFGTSCYRIMLNIKRIDRVSNAEIYDLTQTAPLEENVRTRQLRFLGHVLRMPDDEPCKEYALYIPPHGKRKPGRQRTLFLRYIQHLLGDTDNMIGPCMLSELAQDGCGWR